jgi:hypothetical protein
MTCPTHGPVRGFRAPPAYGSGPLSVALYCVKCGLPLQVAFDEKENDGTH